MVGQPFKNRTRTRSRINGLHGILRTNPRPYKPAPATLLLAAAQFPRFGVLPGDVNGVIQVQQQAFAPVEKSETEKVVVDKGEPGPQHNVAETETDFAFRRHHLRSQRGIAVHVLDVVGEGRVGVMNQGAIRHDLRVPFDVGVLMDRAIFKLAAFATEQAQLRIRPETALLDPTAHEVVLSKDEKPIRRALWTRSAGTQGQTPWVTGS